VAPSLLRRAVKHFQVSCTTYERVSAAFLEASNDVVTPDDEQLANRAASDPAIANTPVLTIAGGAI
jgi:hypothetical protein